MGQRHSKEARVREIIGLLYEAATSPELWVSALDRLFPIFDSMAAHYFLWNDVLDRPIVSYGSTTYLGQQAALKYYLRIDPRRLLLARYRVGATLLCQEHFDERFVQKNEYFQNYSLPLGRRFLMATNLFKSGATSIVFALLRSPEQGPFGSDDYTLLERIRPDLERVARIHSRFLRFNHERELGQGLLDGLPTCVIASDATARVLRMNNAAASMLRAGDVLRVASGRLVASTPEQTKALHSMIRQVSLDEDVEFADGGCAIVEGNRGDRYGAMITPLSHDSAYSSNPTLPLVQITINSLGRQMGSDRSLTRFFGLTPAEAKLAADVAAGKRLDVLANERGVRMPTLRTQMRAIYSKTGTSRQAELAHLLTSLPKRASKFDSPVSTRKKLVEARPER